MIKQNRALFLFVGLTNILLVNPIQAQTTVGRKLSLESALKQAKTSSLQALAASHRE
jgi:hypothetical protein